jgi:hypothetical protein
MTENEIQKIKEQLDLYLESYTENHIDEYDSEANYVPYGDTYVNGGSDYPDSVYDEIYENFIDWIENDEGIIDEILEESEVDVNDENRAMAIQLAKDM